MVLDVRLARGNDYLCGKRICRWNDARFRSCESVIVDDDVLVTYLSADPDVVENIFLVKYFDVAGARCPYYVAPDCVGPAGGICCLIKQNGVVRPGHRWYDV